MLCTQLSFTDRLRSSVEQAQSLAAVAGRVEFGVEELTVALLQSRGVAFDVLHNHLKVDTRRLEGRLRRTLGLSEHPKSLLKRIGVFLQRAVWGNKQTQTEKQGRPPSTVVCNVFSLAENEARCLNHLYLGTEHALLGLTLAGGVVTELLLEAKVDYQSVRKAVQMALTVR
jgi:ATP-dependent Clp protease ATP-binding subunit ClpA